MALASIPEILEELQAGKLIVLVDDENRENEGDLVIAAEKITPQSMNFMLKEARGVVCLALTAQKCDQLQLHSQVQHNTATLQTAFTVTIDAHPKFGVSTGVSARDRVATVKAAVADEAMPSDLLRPGHINPLRARDGGVLVRLGQTEGSVDLSRLAGLKPAAVICEIMRDDGEMARRADLETFCQKHQLKMCSVADLISYRMHREQFVKRIESVNLPTEWGDFRLHAYQSVVDREPHLALCMGGIGEIGPDGSAPEQHEPVLVRVHSECLTGDIFHSARCDCGMQLATAMQRIAAEKRGVLIYMRQEGRGIGLVNKLKAYRLQEQGLDTVEANLHLGFAADLRDYGIGSQILRDLGIRQIRIMTNNPRKTWGIEGFGLTVTEQLPLITEPGKHNRRYLETKKTRLGHKL